MSIIYKSKWSQHPDTHSVMAAATPVEVLDTKEEMWDCWLSISRRQKSTEENSDYCEAEASQRRGGRQRHAVQMLQRRISEVGIHIFLELLSSAFPGAKETTPTKTLLLPGVCLNTRVVPPFWTASWGRQRHSNQCHQTAVVPVISDSWGSRNSKPCSSRCEFLFDLLSLAASLLICSFQGI